MRSDKVELQYINRRKILKTFGVGIGTLVLNKLSTSFSFAQSPLQKRRNIDSLSPNELAEYEATVAELKKRSAIEAKDKNGYQYQADLHNVSRDHPDDTSGACEHFSEEFFPWHRAHLAIYEHLLREINPKVMLPYWDWTAKPSGNRIPAAFERAASPLFHTGRLPSVVSPVVWDAEEIKNYVQESDWSLFAGDPKSAGGSYGIVEDEPHNALHPFIGPTMGNQGTAAEDPVYWSFHAYIDLIWSRWQKLRPNSFECGSCVLWLEPTRYTVQQTEDTSAFRYEYEYDYSIDEQPPIAGGIVLASDTVQQLNLKAATERTISVAPSDSFITSFSVEKKRSLLRLRGVQIFEDLTYQLNIYVHPKSLNLEELSEDTRKEYFVRTKTIWRSHHGKKSNDGMNSDDLHEIHSRANVFVDITKFLERYGSQDWIVTVLAEALPNMQPDTPEYLAQKETDDVILNDLTDIVQSVEIEKR